MKLTKTAIASFVAVTVTIAYGIARWHRSAEGPVEHTAGVGSQTPADD